jgi:DNA-binding Lrp family transcriptional regulator
VWTDELANSVDSMVLSDGARTLTLRRGGVSGTWAVRRFARVPRPSEVGPVPSTAALFWLPSATPALRARLHALDISWVTDLGEIRIAAPWGTIHRGSVDDAADAAPEPEPVALSPGATAVLQFLVEHPGPATQTRIAAAVGLSQPRVSQVMPELRAAGLVGRYGRAYVAADPAEGFEVLSRRRTTAAATVCWYGVQSPRLQLAALQEQVAAAGVDARLCGDWAADRLAPWRQPGGIVVHADASLDLTAASFVPSPPETATLEVRVEPIRAAWQPAPEIIAAITDQSVDWPVAPVTEVAREILATGGSDAGQAVAELKRAWLRAWSALAARGGR